ncbi:QcrA and Rieske domain-containing protein [Stratiformator vulcanicus]|uniref:Cytochrome b6-f complex iron-sulfur subunit n=1 Tax=Stratiformator vulcanicus TaxID=2527980 RepID=A0A517QXL6_9PLAN|nr:Rieske 2Fe-2S domain-containing protein [Stratiformator vulcanicus]QDT36395.1 Cytochrome b6-f complex iron-sulfur subunit [Stratiformator vulcanicus]
MAAAWAGMIGIPLFRYVSSPLFTQKPGETAENFTRVIPVSKLTPGQFETVSVRGDLTDAWSVTRDRAIGRVFVRLREPIPKGDPTEAVIDVFTTICPHSGCAVQSRDEKPTFYCGCHGACFANDGSRVEKPGGGPNPSPRDLDQLPYRVERDEASNTLWVAVDYREYLPGTPQQILA